ncbi:MAG: glycosyltransferase family protein [Deltaproteobacteria bacterium]|nr:glycosyltransferase family protein [Candidatus Zymogenaceae bacterium]
MIGAVIQARMTSTRLPGKVLMEVNGKPLLEYLVERISYCRNVDRIVIATTTNEADNPIAAFANKRGICCYRGSEDDVLERYFKAAKKFDIDTVIRVTADCPLIDPYLCDAIVEKFKNEHYEYIGTAPSFAEGLDIEIMSVHALQKAHREAKNKSEREHVTLYITSNPHLFRSVRLENETDDSMYRITVDEEVDFKVVESIIDALYKEGERPFDQFQIKRFLDDHPEIYNLNRHIIRNEGLLKSFREEGT